MLQASCRQPSLPSFRLVLKGHISGLAAAIEFGSKAQGADVQRPEFLGPVEAARLTADAVARVARERADWESRLALNRVQRDQDFASRRLNEQLRYDEKRRLDLATRESDKLERLEWERRQRLSWDHQAVEAVREGPDMIGQTARDRATWESKIAYERTQSELAWIGRREQEQRAYDEHRIADLSAFEAEKARQIQFEVQERLRWDRRAVECTNFVLGIPA
jgi:hypothetical protein